MSEGSTQILNWEAPNGKLLLKLIEGLPKHQPFVINVFGSAPLQLQLDATFLSGDVDIFSSEDIATFVEQLGLGKGQSEPYIEVVSESVFIASAAWRDRSVREVFGNVTIYVAGPIDVLVGKLKRLDQKDLKAFDLVKAKTGGPSEAELVQALRRVVDLYRPAFDEENPGGDPIANTRRLWQHLYGHDIDVRAEIIAPALSARREAYGQNAPDRRSTLREIAKDYGATAP